MKTASPNTRRTTPLVPELMDQLDTPAAPITVDWLWHGLIARRNVTLFTSGTFDTLTVYVFSRVRSGITPTINALALILIVLKIAAAVWYEVARRRAARRVDALAPSPN